MLDEDKSEKGTVLAAGSLSDLVDNLCGNAQNRMDPIPFPRDTIERYLA